LRAHRLTEYGMENYVYTARDAGGEIVEASVRAQSRHAAISELRARGLTVVELNEVSEAKRVEQAVRRGAAGRQPFFQRRVRASEMAVLCRQLAISINAGVPLREALESMIADLDHPTLRDTLGDVVGKLHEGLSFSAAIARHPRVFNSLFVALVRSAEESGSLPKTLVHLSESLERRERLARKIRSITAYPAFVGAFFILICGAMTLFVLPRFQDSLTSLGEGQLPLLTRFVFGLNRAMLDNLPVIGVALAGLVAAFTLYRRSEAGRYQLDTFKLWLPVIGASLRKVAVARFCQNLAIMVNGGVAITHAMDIASHICGNRIMEDALMMARQKIIAGSDISTSLGERQVFPNLVIRMVRVGETSGRLPEVLEQVAKAYEDEVESEVTMLTSLLEPVLICLFGGFILVLVLAIYLPVFTMSRGVH